MSDSDEATPETYFGLIACYTGAPPWLFQHIRGLEKEVRGNHGTWGSECDYDWMQTFGWADPRMKGLPWISGY